ncbi:PACE efflux transporter [Burkholderia seminalis]|uniref:PACE efflux transporter n=1 Tax=Burkholderia seminalis TaxID=488731 RepID=UPI00158A4DFD|nr:PACE efflux transporter [Burkholderia seminalis]MDN7592025.1 PACE efflux transporter [Burkholderia seminalis]
MQGLPRRITQAVLYEAIAISCVSPAIAAIFKQHLVYSGALSVTMSAIALLWNIIFNALFERWEASRRQRSRTLGRRLLHATGFEGGLIFMLVPVVSWWLDISWFDALVVDIGLFAFFFCYAFVFQWAFDRVFDVPAATKAS